MTEDTLEQLDPASAGTLDPKLQQEQQDKAQEDTKKRYAEFKARIDICKQYRRKLVANWTANIDYRRGKPFASQTDEDRVAVNLDWSLTKAKQAALFSQIPQIHVSHPPQTDQLGPWVHAYERKLNDQLIMAGIETVMDEVLPDVINAAGVGAALVAYEAITEQVQVPAVDLGTMPPQIAQQIQATGMMPNGAPIPMTQVSRVTDKRYTVNRISPADLLWPVNFTGADFDQAAWIGRSGKVSWAQAQQLFGLTEKDKAKVTSSESKSIQDKLTHDLEKDKVGTETDVTFDEIFYKEYQYDVKAKSYLTIHRLVYVDGIEDPVIDEPWQGQRRNEQTGEVLGALKFPIRVLTLTYITDETIPPSDSAIGRPQVNELNKSRTQMVLQRERSIPLRGFDVNRIDPVIQQSLMRGTWNAMIPVQGNGEKAIWEVARAQMPNEDYTFNQVAKDDLNELWQLGPNQLGNFGSGRQSAAEANTVESNFQTRIGRERAKVAKFFVSIAEVLGGLMALYEDPNSFGQGFDPRISTTLSYSILADSTVLLDANQRMKRLMDFINFTAKSGWVDIGPVIREIATLSGLDPNVVVKPPEPSKPAEPNISLRLTGMEDLLNPLPLAMMIKSGQAPKPEEIEQAKLLIQQAVTAPMPPPGQGPQGPPQGGPGGEGMPPPPPEAMQNQIPPPPPVGIGEANPNMGLMPKINSRADQENLG